ncbi:hypothetical protein ABE137_06990 [Brevibacillus laterosporus]|uniref:hypothetical protein n=1 Tax=Brevibacillus laterosporus TaxID=1465 RepID=UPI003D20381C
MTKSSRNQQFSNDHLVPCSRSARLIRKFRLHGIHFEVEAIPNSDNVQFVFPDLPVKQYHVVHLVFGEAGHVYLN